MEEEKVQKWTAEKGWELVCGCGRQGEIDFNGPSLPPNLAKERKYGGVWELGQEGENDTCPSCQSNRRQENPAVQE